MSQLDEIIEASVPCFSCPTEFGDRAVSIATVPHKDGAGKIAFGAPLCRSHATYALIAGWNPIYPLGSAEGRRLWDEHGWNNPALASARADRNALSQVTK